MRVLERARAPRLLLLVLLAAALPGCANRVRVESENFSTRVSLVVIHHTTENFADSLEILTERSAYPVSSHYLIPEPDDPTYDEGELRVYELVPETYRAWHAGESYWGGRTSLNDQSIGIELVNRTALSRPATGLSRVPGTPASSTRARRFRTWPLPASVSTRTMQRHRSNCWWICSRTSCNVIRP